MMRSVRWVVGMWILLSVFSAAEPTKPSDKLDKPCISIDLQAVDVHKALQLLAKFAKLNLVVEESIQGKVSLHLTEVPAEEALQAILQLNDLTQRKKGHTRIISRKKGNTNEVASSEATLKTQQLTVKHRSAKEIAELFQEGQFTKTPGSDLSVDTLGNSLWVRDTPERINALETLVNAVDKVVQQVLIEARIVSVNRNFDRSLGVRFNLKPLSAPATIEAVVKEPTEPDVSDALPLNFDFPSAKQAINTMWPPLWRGFHGLLDLELAAMENEGNGRIIASPHLITLDGTTASIEAGSEIPYQEKSRYGTSVAFKKAVVSLKVSPDIKPSGKILLKLEVHHDKPGTPSVEKTTTIDTQCLKTHIIVNSGETVALGGIYETMERQSDYRFPGLGNLPIVGRLFTQKMRLNNTRELIVFVTPHLVSEALLKQREGSQASL